MLTSSAASSASSTATAPGQHRSLCNSCTPGIEMTLHPSSSSSTANCGAHTAPPESAPLAATGSLPAACAAAAAAAAADAAGGVAGDAASGPATEPAAGAACRRRRALPPLLLYWPPLNAAAGTELAESSNSTVSTAQHRRIGLPAVIGLTAWLRSPGCACSCPGTGHQAASLRCLLLQALGPRIAA